MTRHNHNNEGSSIMMKSNLFDQPFLYKENESYTLDYNRSRRRKREEQCVKLAMKGVLLSPVIVLVLWSIIAITFTKHQTSGKRVQSSRSEDLMSVVEVVSTALGESEPDNLRIPLAAPAGSAQTATIVRPPHAPRPRLNNPNIVYPNEYMMANSKVIVQPENLPKEPLLSAVEPQMQAVQPMQIAQAPQQGAVQPMQIAQAPLQQQVQPMQVLQAPQTQAVEPMKVVQAPMQASAPKTVYYFYDPRHLVEQNGKMILPDIVYDQHGKPHSLAKLQAKELYIEPPSGMSQQQSAPLQSEPLKGSSTPEELPSPPLQTEPMKGVTQMNAPMEAMPDSMKWGESSATDQSIIIATVGIMALLVGAVSARRMRGKSVLAACIENETLEDDVAYDAAYTVHSNGSYYRTFDGGWKGDLEKFDV